MPLWSTQPSEHAWGADLHLIRVPPGRPSHVVCLSTDLLGCNTHYFRGRTTPCRGDSCPACADGLSWRWRCYLAVVDLSTHQRAILELTASATQPVIAYRQANGTLRGCHIIAQRQDTRRNSRLFVRCLPADLQKIQLPPDPPLAKILCHIWGIPYVPPPNGKTLRGHPTIGPVSKP